MWFIILGFLCIFSNEVSSIDDELPCNFIDSINISAGVLHFNQSILYNGMIFPEEQYAKVNYILTDGTKPTIVEPYFRGCPCKIRPCIRLCCPFGSSVDLTDSKITCSGHKSERSFSDGMRSFSSKIIDENNQSEELDLYQHFAFIDRICKLHFVADDFLLTNVL